MVSSGWRFKATAAAPDRLGAVDAARGVALAAMVVFHARWDAAWLGLAGEGRSVGSGWQAFGDGVAAVFLLLSGVSLVLADRRGASLRRKLTRLAQLAAVALAITAATWVAVPDLVVTCGIIHCVVLGDALALPLRRAPWRIVVAVACALFALPLLPIPVAWDGPAAAWFGLGAHGLDTLDYRPLAPWAGFVPLGVLVARRLPDTRLAGGRRWRPLRWMGRHSLFVYLTHQAALYPAVLVLALALGAPEPVPPWSAAFDRQCRADCQATGADAALCGSTCDCTRRGVVGGSALASRDPASDRARLVALARACFSEAAP